MQNQNAGRFKIFFALVTFATGASGCANKQNNDASLAEGFVVSTTTIQAKELISALSGESTSQNTTNSYVLVEEAIPAGTPGSQVVLFTGMAAGPYNPNKLKSWNKYAFPNVIAGGNGDTTRGQYGNVYASEIIRNPDGSILLFYHGNDYRLETTQTDMIYQAVSSNFLGRMKFDLSAPMWTKKAVSLTQNVALPEAPIVGDPTVAPITYDGILHYMMYFSVAGNNPGGWTDNEIGWALSDATDAPQPLGTQPLQWFPANSPQGPQNQISVGNSSEIFAYMQRPSAIYDPSSSLFRIYFDQGGIYGASSATTQHFCTGSGPTDVASSTLHPGCSPAGSSIYGGVSSDGKNFWYTGAALVDSSGNAVLGVAAPATKKFSAGYLMFYDGWNNNWQLDYAEQQHLSYATGTDGQTFTAHGPILDSEGNEVLNPTDMVTNVTQITQGDSLQGVLYGDFPRIPAGGVTSCAYTVTASMLSTGPTPQATPKWCINQGTVNAFSCRKKSSLIATTEQHIGRPPLRMTRIVWN